jgi:hypothetical protein
MSTATKAVPASDSCPLGAKAGEILSHPDVVQLQPMPTKCVVAHHRVGRQVVTAIGRGWAPGDSARCRLCACCSAEDECCLIIVSEHVREDLAPLFSTVGRVEQARPAADVARELPRRGRVRFGR